MSTLVEIESAVAGLPAREQQSLLEWLQSRLSRSESALTALSTDRQVWLNELAALRSRVQTGHAGAPLQVLMDELREERF